ncbi:hypothetical protein AB3R30_19835 [Leptolyngbyaceae cyanobacterium UHCC 1019]
MKYRAIADLYLSQSGIDLKAPAEFDSKDHPELTTELLETLITAGVIESLPVEKVKPTKEASA